MFDLDAETMKKVEIRLFLKKIEAKTIYKYRSEILVFHFENLSKVFFFKS